MNIKKDISTNTVSNMCHISSKNYRKLFKTPDTKYESIVPVDQYRSSFSDQNET